MGDLVQKRDVYSDTSQEEWGMGEHRREGLLKGFLHSNVWVFFFLFSLLLSSNKDRFSIQNLFLKFQFTKKKVLLYEYMEKDKSTEILIVDFAT